VDAFPSRSVPQRASRQFSATSAIQYLTYFAFTYFPIISFSFFRVVAGIFLWSVKIACASADPHLHERSRGIAATVSRTIFVAFSAFFSKTATI
jgi:hypothetical protein